MKTKIMIAMAAGFSVAVSAAQPENVPELMTTFGGEKVSTLEQWETIRAPELLKEFTNEEYGKRPVERPPALVFEKAEPDKVMMDGKAIRKRIRVMYAGSYGGGTFTFTAFIPRQQKPAPAFLLICNRKPSENIDPERQVKSGFWPAEEIVDRGYAAITFWNGDIAPDYDTGNRVGVFAAFEDVSIPYRPKNVWGTLSAWAWGAKGDGLDRVRAAARRPPGGRGRPQPRREDGASRGRDRRQVRHGLLERLRLRRRQAQPYGPAEVGTSAPNRGALSLLVLSQLHLARECGDDLARGSA